MLHEYYVSCVISFTIKSQSVASSWPFIFHVLTTMHGQTYIKFNLNIFYGMWGTRYIGIWDVMTFSRYIKLLW